MECWAGNRLLPYCHRDTRNSTELIAVRRSRQGPLSPAVVDAPWSAYNLVRMPLFFSFPRLG
jgi:hypothetical protein